MARAPWESEVINALLQLGLRERAEFIWERLQFEIYGRHYAILSAIGRSAGRAVVSSAAPPTVHGEDMRRLVPRNGSERDRGLRAWSTTDPNYRL